MKNWTFIKHLMLSIILTIIFYLGSLIVRIMPIINIIGWKDMFDRNQAASVAIIGGSDGPTAIFVRSNIFLALILNRYVMLFVVLLLCYIPIKAIQKRHMQER